jgi:hypothetical protein
MTLDVNTYTAKSWESGQAPTSRHGSLIMRWDLELDGKPASQKIIVIVNVHEFVISL